MTSVVLSPHAVSYTRQASLLGLTKQEYSSASGKRPAELPRELGGVWIPEGALEASRHHLSAGCRRKCEIPRGCVTWWGYTLSRMTELPSLLFGYFPEEPAIH